jgi:hypothetical protein
LLLWTLPGLERTAQAEPRNQLVRSEPRLETRSAEVTARTSMAALVKKGFNDHYANDYDAADRV